MAIKNWKDASEAVREFAAKYGVTAIYWGTGYPVEKPHAVASSIYDGLGYFVRVYPEGDHGYMSMAPCHTATIRIN